MLKLKFSKKDISKLGFFIYLCGSFSNSGVTIVLSFIFFVMTSFSTIKLKVTKYSTYQLLFTILVICSYFWGHKVDSLLNVGFGAAIIVASVFYSSLYIYSNFNSKDDIINYLKILICVGIYYSVQMIMLIPVNNLMNYSLWDDYGFNKNTVGLTFAWVCSIIYFLYKEKYINHKKIYLFIFVILGFFVFISSSRKALLALVLIILLYSIFREKNIKLLNNMLKSTVIATIIIIVSINVPYLYEIIGEKMLNLFQSLFTSVSQVEDYSIWERSFFREYAMKMFFENPQSFFIGHGLNAFATRMYEIGNSLVAYSHCNFTELLCNYGIIGFIFYYFYKLKIYFLALIKKNKSRIEIFFLVFLMVAIMWEYGYVSYYSAYIQVIYIVGFNILQFNRIKYRMK